MIQQKLKILAQATLCLTSSSLFANPWFTGPLLAGSGHTIPAGHINFEPYFFQIDNVGFYDTNWQFIDSPHSKNVIVNPILSIGLTDKIDVQYSVPYMYNQDQHRSDQHVGDVSAGFGYQVIEQKNSLYRPDLRIAFREVIPTGKFNRLHDTYDGNDGTGNGSYQTGVSFNFQHLLPFNDINYLRTRLSLSYYYSDYVHIRGNSVYGGNSLTNGTVSPGNQYSIDMAGEYSLTQNWTLVMEAYYANRGSARFFGFPGLGADAIPAILSQGHTINWSLAPAIEYNINSNVGIIAGYWFTVAGRQTNQANAAVIAVNIYV